MSPDPIVAELHRQRAEEMERFNFDFEAYCRYLKQQEKRAAGPLRPPPASPPNPAVPRVRSPRR